MHHQKLTCQLLEISVCTSAFTIDLIYHIMHVAILYYITCITYFGSAESIESCSKKHYRINKMNCKCVLIQKVTFSTKNLLSHKLTQENPVSTQKGLSTQDNLASQEKIVGDTVCVETEKLISVYSRKLVCKYNIV